MNLKFLPCYIDDGNNDSRAAYFEEHDTIELCLGYYIKFITYH